MSLQTRLAQAAAQDALKEWKRHVSMCPRCAQLARNRSATPCASGAPLRNEEQRLRAQARLEAQLDRQPNPDQEALF